MVPKNVKIYSTRSCPFCRELKNFLREKNVEFEDVDVSASPLAAIEMIEKTGQMGVPVTDIEGKVIIGLDIEKISDELEI